MTARTLGLDEKYDIVFRVLSEVSEANPANVSFEEFLKALTTRIVIFLNYHREIHSLNKEKELTLVYMIFKEEENLQLINLNMSMINLNMDLMINKYGK